MKYIASPVHCVVHPPQNKHWRLTVERCKQTLTSAHLLPTQLVLSAPAQTPVRRLSQTCLLTSRSSSSSLELRLHGSPASHRRFAAGTQSPGSRHVPAAAGHTAVPAGRDGEGTSSVPTQVCKASLHAPTPLGSAFDRSIHALEDIFDQHPALVTGFFFFLWYFLNVVFNILNKKIYNYFPYPYFVSTIHLMVGVTYCSLAWGLGLPKRAPINRDLVLALAPVAFCHALGHVMTNVSFSSVAVSFTHTVKALEPFFSAAASQFVLGQALPLHLWASLMPVVFGVCLASVTELSFNWTGFLTAMVSNISFTYRNIFSKKAMVGMDSTNLYAYISILSLLYCIPLAVVMEGPQLMAVGFRRAIATVGLTKFLVDLFWVGMFYHLYNQLANNTLERVSPLTHAVGNVLKRVFVIGFSIIIFGNRISNQTAIGTGVAIAGVALYSMLKAKGPKKVKG